jgi:hypothetical protein
VNALIGLIGQAYFDALATITASPSAPMWSRQTKPKIASSSDRRTETKWSGRDGGRGVFRSNVLLREDYCRVTKVDDRKHLKASHIKPWRDATDAQRLDGANGLLLSPHIDHLFDQGYISFSSTQQLLVVPEVRDKLLDAWGIAAGVGAGEFSPEQNAYLDHHRINVFKGDV